MKRVSQTTRDAGREYISHTVEKLCGLSGSFIFQDITFFSSAGARAGVGSGVEFDSESESESCVSSPSLLSIVSSSSIWLSAASCLYLISASWWLMWLMVWTKSWKWFSWVKLNPRSPRDLKSAFTCHGGRRLIGLAHVVVAACCRLLNSSHKKTY